MPYRTVSWNTLSRGLHLYALEEPDPHAAAYWATGTVHQLASDYDAMLKGAPAPWE